MASWPARRRAYALLLVVALVIVGLDHLTKWLVVQNISLDGSVGATCEEWVYRATLKFVGGRIGANHRWSNMVLHLAPHGQTIAAADEGGSVSPAEDDSTDVASRP